MRVNTYVVYVHWWKTCKEPTICTYFRVMDKSLSPTAPTQSFWRWLSTVVYEIPILEKRIKYRSSKFPDILVCLLSDVDSLTEEMRLAMPFADIGDLTKLQWEVLKREVVD